MPAHDQPWSRRLSHFPANTSYASPSPQRNKTAAKSDTFFYTLCLKQRSNSNMFKLHRKSSCKVVLFFLQKILSWNAIDITHHLFYCVIFLMHFAIQKSRVKERICLRLTADFLVWNVCWVYPGLLCVYSVFSRVHRNRQPLKINMNTHTHVQISQSQEYIFFHLLH